MRKAIHTDQQRYHNRQHPRNHRILPRIQIPLRTDLIPNSNRRRNTNTQRETIKQIRKANRRLMRRNNLSPIMRHHQPGHAKNTHLSENRQPNRHTQSDLLLDNMHIRLGEMTKHLIISKGFSPYGNHHIAHQLIP